MITDDNVKIATENWLNASKKLGFAILTPYTISVNKKLKNVFAFLPEYGSSKGIVIDFISPPKFQIDKEIIEWATENKCSYSFINIEDCLEYKESFFREALEDWMKFESH